MRSMHRVLVLAFMLLALTPIFAFNTSNALVNDIFAAPHVDSWPGQATPPLPPAYPGNPSYPGNPGYPPATGNPNYPGNPGYESPDRLFESGQSAYYQGNYTYCIQVLKRFLERYPYEYRAPEATFILAEAHLKTTDYGSALYYYRLVSSKYSYFSQAERATYYIGFCMVKLYDYRGAINEFRNFTARYPFSEFVDDAWFVMGMTYEKLNDKASAISAYQKVVYEYPGSNYYTEAKQRLAALQNSGATPGYPGYQPPQPIPVPPSNPGNSGQLTDYDLYNRAHSEYVAGSFNNAVIYFDELLRRFPGSMYADDASFWKARIRYEQRNYLQAIRLFENFLRYYPNSEYVVEATFTLAHSQKEYGRISAANSQYLRQAANNFAWFQQNYATNRFASEALFQAGECYEILGDYLTADNYFRKAITIYPNTAAAQKCKDKLNKIW